MPDHTNESSTNQDTIAIMDTAPTNAMIPNPYGDLSIFPREIRDEIYRLVLPQTYIAYYSSSIVRPVCYDTPNGFSQRWTGSDLSIIRLSKAISDEAMSVMYLKGTFRFHSGVGSAYPEAVAQRPNADMKNRMTNVDVFYNTEFDPEIDLVTGFTMGFRTLDCYCSAKAGPLEFFQGDTISRKSILLELGLYEHSSYAARMTKSPLFRALKKLTGFETVTLKLYAVAPYYCPPKGTTQTTEQEWYDAGESEKLYAGFEDLLSAMRKELEPTLGSSSAISELISRHDNLESCGERQIIFHPRDHQTAISKEKDTMDRYSER